MALSRLIRSALLAGALVAPQAVSAQTLTLEGLARRVEALETENASLRAQVAELRRADTTPAPAPSPETAAAPEPPSAAAVAYQVESQPPSDRWDRAFVGISAGVTRGGVSFRRLQPPFFDVQHDEGEAFGVQLGRRWQSGALVLGVEVALERSNLDLVFGPLPTYGGQDMFRFGASLGVNGEIGLAEGGWLLFALAGLRVTEVTTDNARITAPGSTILVPQYHTRRNEVGLQYGFGVARQIGDRLSVELEAFRISQGDIGERGAGFHNFPDMDAFRIRLNYLLR